MMLNFFSTATTSSSRVRRGRTQYALSLQMKISKIPRSDSTRLFGRTCAPASETLSQFTHAVTFLTANAYMSYLSTIPSRASQATSSRRT